MKTTIIKILNQIANGEEPPKNIIISFEKLNERDEIFEYVKEYNDYFDEHGDRLFEDYGWINMLNYEVTILETTITYKPDKIEKIDIDITEEAQLGINAKIIYKINELIDRYNNEG